MIFVTYGLAIAMFLFSVGMSIVQVAQGVSGADQAGRLRVQAQLSAKQAELFAASCVESALRAPGLSGVAVGVASAPADVALPAGAACMVVPRAAPAAGRDIYAYMVGSGGQAGAIRNDSHADACWYVVSAPGAASSLADGTAITLPAAIPVGAVVRWVYSAS